MEDNVSNLPVTASTALPSTLKPSKDFIPRTMDEALDVARVIVAGDLAPDSYREENRRRLPAEQVVKRVVVGIMKGAEVGLPPMAALSNIAIVRGRPCIWGDGVTTLLRASGLLEEIEEWFTGKPHTDEWTGHCRMKRRGVDRPVEHSFSMADAKRAKLLGNPTWIGYPQRMLMMRPRSWCARDLFADVLSGLGVAEEQMDVAEPRDVTPAKDVVAALHRSPERRAIGAAIETSAKQQEDAAALQELADEKGWEVEQAPEAAAEPAESEEASEVSEEVEDENAHQDEDGAVEESEILDGEISDEPSPWAPAEPETAEPETAEPETAEQHPLPEPYIVKLRASDREMMTATDLLNFMLQAFSAINAAATLGALWERNKPLRERLIQEGNTKILDEMIAAYDHRLAQLTEAGDA